MKKLSAMLMAGAMMMSLAACGSSASSASSEAVSSEAASSEVASSAASSEAASAAELTTVTPGKLTLDHIARFDAEREAAGIAPAAQTYASLWRNACKLFGL